MIQSSERQEPSFKIPIMSFLIRLDAERPRPAKHALTLTAKSLLSSLVTDDKHGAEFLSNFKYN